MTIKELRQATGMNQTAFAKYFEIPLRTVQDWEAGRRQPLNYLLKLMQYKLEKEGLI
ncbi:MAG: helix-turn-helix domain-containing protein [Oscillospiraceae bacterium]|nr:helix-turn-helix domain-containing protein [Oscillospiraceae bacterium]